MAGNSVVGALRVDLGLNSAQFRTGMKLAQGDISKFGKIAALSFAGLVTAAAGAAAAFGLAVRGAIDHADALNKAAIKVGTSVEALSRLEYAARLSDVSLDQLTGGLQKLSKSMADAATSKTSTAATAFKALGIAVTDASGQLRGSDEVFADVADRFSRMEDGATKTALAMQIFGRSGADLIPLLDTGTTGLKQMADEADRLGVTIDDETAIAAEGFNDTLTRIGAMLQGVANKVMEAALPALQGLANTLASPDFATAAQWLATTIVGAIDRIIQATIWAIQKIKELQGAIDPQFNVYNADGTLKEVNTGIIGNTFDALGSTGTYSSVDSMWSALSGSSAPSVDVTDTIEPTFSDAASGAAKALEPLDLGISDVNEGLTETVSLGEQIGSTLADVFTDFAEALIEGGDALGVIFDALKNIGKQLLNEGLQKLFSIILGGVFGGIGGGYVPGFGAYGSFAGGGYTGDAPRSGGLDGQGGFLAMLHPQESVFDHAQGQSAGGPQISISITGSRNDAAEIAAAIHKELPNAIAAYNRNPYRR